MRASTPTRAVFCVLAALASGLAASAVIVPAATPVASEPAAATAALSAFDRFELADVALDAALRGNEGNERARRELQMHLRDRLGPWLEARNAQSAQHQPPRRLRMEPTIMLLKVVDPGVRLAVGPWVGAEQLHVRVRFVDAAKGEAIGEVLLRADGTALTPVASLGAVTPPLPRRIADALADYLDAALVQARAPSAAIGR